MAYVVFNTETTRLVRRKNGAETFKTAAAAQAHITRSLDGSKYAVAAANDYYANIEQQVERVNLITGKTYMESVNTPGFMSPASEAYWSA
jgi:hypothetical protein